MKFLLMIMFLGFSVLGHSQFESKYVKQYVLGLKNGCADAGNKTKYDSIMYNPAISIIYKEAYSHAWEVCIDPNCKFVNRQIQCDGYTQEPTTDPRPPSEDGIDTNRGSENP